MALTRRVQCEGKALWLCNSPWLLGRTMVATGDGGGLWSLRALDGGARSRTGRFGVLRPARGCPGDSRAGAARGGGTPGIAMRGPCPPWNTMDSRESWMKDGTKEAKRENMAEQRNIENDRRRDRQTWQPREKDT